MYLHQCLIKNTLLLISSAGHAPGTFFLRQKSLCIFISVDFSNVFFSRVFCFFFQSTESRFLISSTQKIRFQASIRFNSLNLK